MSEATTTTTVRRVPVNGRVWKVTEAKPPLTKNKLSGQGWDKRQLIRRQDTILKTIKSEMLAEKEAEKAQKKKTLEERRKRKEENERKAEVVMKVSAAKMKRMKKKQLRLIRKA
jgi:rRNA-processing protein CGR1